MKRDTTIPYGRYALKDGIHHCILWVYGISNASWFMLMVIIYWVEVYIL